MLHKFPSQRGPITARCWGNPEHPRLLMLHGFPEYSGAWARLADYLTDHYYCIAPDQRGYGQTGGPDDVSAYTTSALVQDMVDVIGTQPVTVLGHDWGAAVAYGLAMFHPHLVDRLIVLNGVHPVPFQRAMASGGAQSQASQYIEILRKPGSETTLAANNFEKLMRLFSANMDLSWLTPSMQAKYHQEWARPGRLKTMLHWYRASPLIVAKPGQPVPIPPLPLDKLHIPQPHLLIWGENDTALLPEATQGLENFAPHLTRQSIAETDHWVAHQNPKAVAQHILSWSDALNDQSRLKV